MKRRRAYFRAPLLVKTLVVLAGAALVSPFFLRKAIVDVAPLARLQLSDGTDLNPRVRLSEWESPYALTDGLSSPDHLFEFPAGCIGLRLEFPKTFNLVGLHVVAIAGGPQAPTTARLSTPGRRPVMAQAQWYHEPLRSSECLFELGSTPASVVEFEINEPSPPWASVNVLMTIPRYVAWLYAIALTILLPMAAALTFAGGVVGLGVFRRDGDPGVVVARGLASATAIALAWTLLPRSLVVDALFATIWVAAALRGILLLGNRAADRRLLVLASVFLVVSTQVESYSLSDARVSPVDHLHAHYGARRLSREIPINAELSERPWLLHVVAAPWDRLFGRLGYWGYVGVVAGLNSLSLLAAESILRRLGTSDVPRALAWFVLLPGFVNIHFLGQRLLAGTLAIAALTWLLERRRNVGGDEPQSPFVAGLAFVLGIGLHPSAAFVVATTAACLLFTRPRRGVDTLLGVGLPITIYAAWLLAMSIEFPGQRNNLLVYPVTRDISQPFPPGMKFVEALRSLSVDDWQALAVNRVAHLRHYIVPANWSPAIWTWGRWISLPNVLCWGGVLLLLARRSWRGREAWCLWAIAAPLLFHHFFLGQPDPKFHMGPAPFIALMLLASATLAEPQSGGVWERILRFCILAEIGVRLLWPLIACKQHLDIVDPIIIQFRLVGGDAALYFVLAALPDLVGWPLVRIALRKKAATEASP